MDSNFQRLSIIGAGFAGLSTGRHLRRRGVDSFKIYEAADAPGGLARSFRWHGFDCDMAPHRLFTEDKALLAEMLALSDFHQLKRKSRIYINGKWIRDPVRITDLFSVLSFKGMGQLVRARVRGLLGHFEEASHFESFVQARYGQGVSDMFFKPYAEKLFGLPADQISVHWAQQKVRVTGLKELIFRNSKLYFDHFYYPCAGGYGAMVDGLMQDLPGKVQLGHRLNRLHFEKETGRYYAQYERSDGSELTVESEVIISSMPLPTLSALLGYGSSLQYRKATLLYLWVDQPRVLPDHWVYILDAHYDINRITEFKNFMAQPEGARTVLCVEVTRSEAFSIDRILAQLSDLKLLSPQDVLDTHVIHLSHAYPVYDLTYAEEVQRTQQFLDQFPNLYLAGRQGLFRHQDVDQIFQSTQQLVDQLVDAYALV